MKKVLYAAVIALLTISSNALSDDNIKKEIIDRCRSQMSEYGASMVKACVDQGLQAVSAFDKYSGEYSSIVDRCMAQMRDYGYSMLKACSDQDIETEKALSDY